MPKLKDGKLVNTHADLQKYAEGVALAMGKKYYHIPNYNVKCIGPKRFIHSKGKKENNGFVDLLVVGKRYSLYLELKTGNDKLRSEQREFRDYCLQYGHHWIEARDEESILREISAC
jgi:hypothetical protein